VVIGKRKVMTEFDFVKKEEAAEILKCHPNRVLVKL
jgi:hypothetical protein